MIYFRQVVAVEVQEFFCFVEFSNCKERKRNLQYF